MGTQLQLDLFQDFLTKEPYSNCYELLTSLPIWVYSHNNPSQIEVKRDFLYREQKYQVVVKKTRLSVDDDSFLGSIDQDVLDVLLYLGTLDITPRDIVDNKVRIKVSINKIYTTLQRKIRFEEIKKSIQRLKETVIKITPLDTTKPYMEWNTETIISQYIIQDERTTKGDDTLTYIEFNSVFSKELLKGKIKKINFPVYISLKNSISKYIYKRLVLSDFFSTDDYSKYYHNKSLYTFLLNSGYQSGTTQDRNNTLRTFRLSIKELKNKGILSNCEMTPIKEKNKVVDYFIKLTPSRWLVEENHNQRKIKRFKGNKGNTKYQNNLLISKKYPD